MADIDGIVDEAAHLWDAGRFFACHDKLEEAWQGVKHEKKAEPARDPRRDLLHAVILFCAAYVHWERGNALGVERKLQHAREALAKTQERRLRGRDATLWLADVVHDLARGARGVPWAEAGRPRWPR